jgi:hypothetical protein
MYHVARYQISCSLIKMMHKRRISNVSIR